MKINEIEAHSFFENLQVSTKIGEKRWNWGALLIWKRAIFDENGEIDAHSLFENVPYPTTIGKKLWKIGEIEAHSLF